jgi:sec-independent protein translocase protein TatA
MLGAQELIMILLIVVVVFGAKRIPEIMEGLGKGIKTFKKAMEGEEVNNVLSPQQSRSAPTPTAAQNTGGSAAPAAAEKTEPK